MPAPALSEIHVDDLPCLVNPVLAADLAICLERTPESRRVAVAQAFLGLTVQDWSLRAGLPKPSVWRWFEGESRLPFGGAYRLAKVIGQSPEVLFAALV